MKTFLYIHSKLMHTHASPPCIAGWLRAKACLCFSVFVWKDVNHGDAKNTGHLFPGSHWEKFHSSVCVCVCMNLCVSNKNVDSGLSCLTWTPRDITSFTTLPYLKAGVEPEGIQRGFKVKVLTLFTPAAHPLTEWWSGRLRMFLWTSIVAIKAETDPWSEPGTKRTLIVFQTILYLKNIRHKRTRTVRKRDNQIVFKTFGLSEFLIFDNDWAFWTNKLTVTLERPTTLASVELISCHHE